MRTRSSANLPVVSPNPLTSNLKRRNHRRSKQPFSLEESPIDTMADQRTMAELLRAPTEGYAEAIMVPLILAEQFELKHTNLRNEISNFQQWFDESFHEAWDRYKDFLWACPHHGFTELHQPDTFYNTLNPADQDSLNAAGGGNLLERCTQDMLTIIKNKSKVRNSQNKAVVSQVKSFDAYSNSFSEIAKLTHAVNQQTSDVTTAMTAILKQVQATSPPVSTKAVEEICVTCDGAHLYYQFLAAGSGSLPSNTVANPKGQLKAITTQSGLVLDGPTVPIPPTFINLREDKSVEESLTDQDLSEYTIKKLQELVNTTLNENSSAVILKKLLEKLGDPRKFLIPCGFNELKCKALADLGASFNLMPLSVWKKLADFVIVDYESDPRVPLILGGPFLQTARALIDVHGEEMILCDGDERLTLNMRHDTSSYSNQPQKESINLINVFNNSSKYFLEDLFSINQPSSNPTFSSHPELTSPEVKDDIQREAITTYSSSPNQLLEEFADELALVTFPLKYNDDLQFDIKSDLKEIEYLMLL
uniref:Reverse transcriptase domain-containing protein n=1 Tax=Tanacetum cinerariifolium TaxID=118510 RepID=A0A6L2K5W0_TANCI|nr:reverse transcriptase domain-containing protein [Tanacetum cinerariifolium]